MGYSPGGVRFSDGHVLFFGHSTTSDISDDMLSSSPGEASLMMRRTHDNRWARMKNCKMLGHTPEPVLAMLLDDPEPWAGTACRLCHVFHGPHIEWRMDGLREDVQVTSECRVNGGATNWFQAALDRFKE